VCASVWSESQAKNLDRANSSRFQSMMRVELTYFAYEMEIFMSFVAVNEDGKRRRMNE
jgi:hypothetical protein